MHDAVMGLGESLRLKRQFFEQHREVISAQAVLLAAALKKGNKLLAFGNGGSAADASRAVTCLVRNGLPGVSLPMFTAAEALTFEQLYRALRRPGDCALAISTSGNSPNILQAVRAARQLGDPVIAFTGNNGGQLKLMVPQALVVSSSSTPRIQEVHLMLVHEFCSVVLGLLK